MNLKKILTTIAFATSLSVLSLAQQEKYSLSIGGSYMIPKRELRKNFNFLKGLEISIEKPINQKSSLSISYYSGYKWGPEPQTRELEPKINADELSISYNHKIRTQSKVKPFYELGLGYERFGLEINKGQKRIMENTNGETLNFEIGAKINLNKKKNKELYLGIEKELFISNTKTNQRYSNIKINVGINFKKYSRSKLNL
jgi:hypothetical protein